MEVLLLKHGLGDWERLSRLLGNYRKNAGNNDQSSQRRHQSLPVALIHFFRLGSEEWKSGTRDREWKRRQCGVPEFRSPVVR
jgi:hypothetical protein